MIKFIGRMQWTYVCEVQMCGRKRIFGIHSSWEEQVFIYLPDFVLAWSQLGLSTVTWYLSESNLVGIISKIIWKICIICTFNSMQLFMQTILALTLLYASLLATIHANNFGLDIIICISLMLKQEWRSLPIESFWMT